METNARYGMIQRMGLCLKTKPQSDVYVDVTPTSEITQTGQNASNDFHLFSVCFKR